MDRPSSRFGTASNGIPYVRCLLKLLEHVTHLLLVSTLQGTSTIAQLAMVPLQNTHSVNGVIEPDRMLMISGSLDDSLFGNASSALFDGQTFIPYIVSTSSTGTPGTISSLFHSFSTFSFSQHRKSIANF